eukprot:g2832.t1
MTLQSSGASQDNFYFNVLDARPIRMIVRYNCKVGTLTARRRMFDIEMRVLGRSQIPGIHNFRKAERVLLARNCEARALELQQMLMTIKVIFSQSGLGIVLDQHLKFDKVSPFCPTWATFACEERLES